MTLAAFQHQTIQVVADHELNTWDYSFKDLTATVQFKSMKMSFLHTDLQGCKDFESKLISARAIFGTARIPADNLINALIDAGYKLVKTEVNRPSQTTIPRYTSQFETPIALLNSSNDNKLMSDMHSVKCGGPIESSTAYKVGEASMRDEWSTSGNRAAPSDSGVSRNGIRSVYTINLSNPTKGSDLADAIMEAFAAIDQGRAKIQGV